MISKITEWDEVQSKVYNPALLLIVFVATAFLPLGLAGCLMPPEIPGASPHFVQMIFAVIALFGFGAMSCAMWSVRTVWIRHATPDSVAMFSQEPVITDDVTFHCTLTHELVMDASGWKLVPRLSLLRTLKYFFMGFGIALSILFATVLTGILDRDMSQNWTVAALIGFSLTTICGGIPMIIMYHFFKKTYQSLPSLLIPSNAADLVYETSLPVDSLPGGLISHQQVNIDAKHERTVVLIPQHLIAAVQVCAWKYVLNDENESTTTWAVQGLLVLRNAENDQFQRIPILMTQDFVGLAKLMQALGRVLNVPFIYSANATAWKAETRRSKTRPPLRRGRPR